MFLFSFVLVFVVPRLQRQSFLKTILPLMGPHVCLAPDISVMQGHCDKSTSHVITEPKCVTSINQLFLFSLRMLYVAPSS